MRHIPVLILLNVLVWPNLVSGQGFEVNGAAGPSLYDKGNSFAVGGSYSPHRLMAIGFGFERTHLESTTERDGDVISSFRGGTVYLGTADFQISPFGRDRFGPFGVAGLAAGWSFPNVNEEFPNYRKNYVQAVFLGGGVHVPVGDHLKVTGDFRMTVGAEGREGMVAFGTLRAGVAWRF